MAISARKPKAPFLLFLLGALFGASLITSGCSSSPSRLHDYSCYEACPLDDDVEAHRECVRECSLLKWNQYDNKGNPQE